MALGNDIKKILALRDQVRRGAVTITDVLHDDWCAKLNGGALCNCDPEIRPSPLPRSAPTDDDGDVS
jgi:hypothetical protein